MLKDVAVFVDDDGITASLSQPGKIVIYQRYQGAWRILREKPFCLNLGQGLRMMRTQMAELLAFLDGCKIFLGQSVTGVPYFELEKADISVWEFAGKPLDFLEYILAAEEKAQMQQANEREIYQIPVPKETAHGYYQISIKDIQENNGAVTSKQVLLPFIRQGSFYALEVVCNHIPPWLEGELAIGKLASRIEKVSNNEMRVTITKQVCQS